MSLPLLERLMVLVRRPREAMGAALAAARGAEARAPGLGAGATWMGRDGEADVADLLGRQAVKLDTPEIQRFIAGRRVLVTGAGGSIGSEICRQAMRFCPSRLVMLDRSEAGLFEIDRELASRWIGSDLAPVIADICDEARLRTVFAEHRPEVIFHAAAHKHVPLMEQNPGEAVKVNVFGTALLARLAAEGGSRAFVLISTDKAVAPASVMGATKRLAEMVVQGMNRQEKRRRDEETERRSEPGCAIDVEADTSSIRLSVSPSLCTTSFSAVRFGNVLGSSGSVVPIFARQIAAGGPVTVTHPEMRRFFMTIPEAAGLVMQAGAIGRGGEVFVLDMGQPVRILDLAEGMIRRAGLAPGQDIAIRITGVRPGEKLEEQLAGSDETTLPTTHEKIRVWELPQVSASEVAEMLAALREVADESPERVVSVLGEVLPEFGPAAGSLRMRIAA